MKVGVLFLHGFTGGPMEVRPLYRYLERTTEWELVSPTLTGHGLPLRLDHPDANAQTWYFEAVHAYELLAERVDRVVVVGFSMGGVLASMIAAQYPVTSLILLSPAAKYVNVPQLFENLYERWITEWEERPVGEGNFYHLYDYKLRVTPLRATLNFLEVVSYAKGHYERVTAPACFVHGLKDGVVPIRSSYYLYDTFASTSKRMIISGEGKHHICYSKEAPSWFGEVKRFIDQSLFSKTDN